MTFDAHGQGVTVSVDAHRGTRLRGERDRLRLTQADLAEAVGVRREMWARYESGTEPGASVLAAAAAAGVDVLYVLTGRREAHAADGAAVLGAAEVGPAWPAVSAPAQADRPGATPAAGGTQAGASSALLANAGPDEAPLSWVVQAGPDRREYKVIPSITEHVCAGLPPADSPRRADVDHSRAGVLAFEATFMREALGSDEDRYLTLRVEGDSMAPTLFDGDLVAIDATVSRINVSGIYVLRFAGALTIKRVMRKSDGAVVVASDNRAYAAADETFTAVAAETLSVVGRMVWPRVR